MFPSEAYKKLCIENAEMLREEWKNRGWKPDDWFYNPTHEEVHLLAHSRTHDIWFRDAPKRFARFLEHNIPLPSQRQLIELLEERVLCKETGQISLNGPYADMDGIWTVHVGIEGEYTAFGEGPDPETALLRAWLEVVRDGVPEVVKG